MIVEPSSGSSRESSLLRELADLRAEFGQLRDQVQALERQLVPSAPRVPMPMHGHLPPPVPTEPVRAEHIKVGDVIWKDQIARKVTSTEILADIITVGYDTGPVDLVSRSGTLQRFIHW